MRFFHGLVIALGLGLLAGCTTQDALQIERVSNRVEHPLPAKMQTKLARMSLRMSSPIMIRVFKQEAVMEVWKANSADRYQMVATYPICAWSGQLGPKKKEGDRQAPEGFYSITPGQMNPNSSYYLSFDTGYPNKFDRAYGRSGRNIMVHGACSSAGCYSMSDAAVLQIYAFAREAFRGGQKAIQMQAFPFRMTAENMAKHRGSEHYEFWKNIKVGYDYFEITHRPPEVNVCGKKYAFNEVAGCSSGTPPALTAAYSSYSKTYDAAFASASAKYAQSDWKDTPEFERKAAERLAKRMGKKPKVANDAEYVVVDPKAKITPTSDTVTSYSAAYAKVEAIRNGTLKQVEYISVAEVEARKKIEAEKRKEDEKLAKRLAKAKIPIPEPNPIKPVETVAAADAAGQSKPFWKIWDSGEQEKRDTAGIDLPVAAAGEQTAKVDDKVADKPSSAERTAQADNDNKGDKADKSKKRSLEPVKPVDAAEKAGDKPADNPEDGAVTTTATEVKEKPFWKLW